MNCLVVSGSYAEESRTRVLAQAVAAECQQHDIEAELLTPRDHNLPFCDGRPFDQYNQDVTAMQDLFAAADSYVFCVPVYNWSLPGGFKNMLDLIPPRKMNGDVAGVVGTGENMKGFLTIQRELTSIMHYFNIHVIPHTVFAERESITSDAIDHETRERVQTLVSQVQQLTRQKQGI